MSELAVRWVFQLDADYVYGIRRHLPTDWNEGVQFLDRKGKARLVISASGDARVLGGYAWDGCTPKLAVFDIVLGTPDGIPNETTKKPKAYYASLLHDALYQFLDAGLPLHRRQADQVFLEILTRDRFAPRWIYFVAVRVFGGVFRLFTRWKRQYHGTRLPHAGERGT